MCRHPRHNSAADRTAQDTVSHYLWSELQWDSSDSFSHALGSLSWSQQSPECLKHAAGLKVQHAWPRPHITVGHPGLQRKDSQSCLLPTTSCQNAAEAALKLNIWIEWDRECGLSERCFTKAIRRGPVQHSHAVPSQHQIAMASLCNQQNYMSANLIG